MQVTILPPRNIALCAPLTSNRDLGSCLIANIPMQELYVNDLIRAGLQLVDPAEAEERTIRIPIDNWIELGSILLLGRTPGSVVLVNEENQILAWKGADSPELCTDRLVTSANCFSIVYPWDLLRMNEQVLQFLDESSILGEVAPSAIVSGVVRIAQGAKILPGTIIEGPVTIGANTVVGPNAYIRGATSIAANCYIGHNVEIKNSIVYPNTYISRHCYVGDSIIGSHVTLGASTCTENHRHDGRNHHSIIKGVPVDTGRLKFGAIIGDGVRTGVNTSIEPGIKIGVARTTSPGSTISKDIM